MQPQEQPVVKIGQLEIRYLMDGNLTGAGAGMFELTVPPGARVPPAHSHRDNEEIVYVLEGTLRYSVDDEVRDLKLHDLQCDDTAYVNDTIQFEARLTGQGYKDLVVPVVLKVKGKDGKEKELEALKTK